MTHTCKHKIPLGPLDLEASEDPENPKSTYCMQCYPEEKEVQHMTDEEIERYKEGEKIIRRQVVEPVE